MHLEYRNVNSAFVGLVNLFDTSSLTDDFKCAGILVKTKSRVGDVLQIPEPMTLTYEKPLERVLFNETRDCNPFFHLMEALWMLNGRNDLAPLQYYVSTFGEFSDDGKTLNGAYGERWRRGIGGSGCAVDQLDYIIELLRQQPSTRRAVLAMWNHDDDLANALYSSDICCNLSVAFLINNGRLDMTVFNRSNDLIWGALGANYVHFSFLQEYLAAHIGVQVGVYNQISNNLHVYTERFKPKEWLADTTPDYYAELPRLNSVSLVADPEQFDIELKHFNENWLGRDLGNFLFSLGEYKEPFFSSVALPAAKVFHFHKNRNYESALNWANTILADDWRRVCVNWIRRRQARYERAADDGVSYNSDNPYLENELKRQQTGSEHS